MPSEKHKFSLEHIKDMINKGLTMERFHSIKHSLRESGVSEHNLKLMEKELEHYETKSPEHQKKIVEINVLIHSKQEELKKFDKWIDKPFYRIFFDEKRQLNKISFGILFIAIVSSYHLTMKYGSAAIKNAYGVIGFILFFYVIGLLYIWRGHEDLKDAVHDLEIIKKEKRR